jgi:hypothetical protein
MTTIFNVTLSGTAYDLTLDFVQRLNNDITACDFSQRLAIYQALCSEWLERNATIHVRSATNIPTHPPTSSSFLVPVEELPFLVQDQGRRDGLNIPMASVASAMADAGLPTHDYSVVSILVITQ